MWDVARETQVFCEHKIQGVKDLLWNKNTKEHFFEMLILWVLNKLSQSYLYLFLWPFLMYLLDSLKLEKNYIMD